MSLDVPDILSNSHLLIALMAVRLSEQLTSPGLFLYHLRSFGVSFLGPHPPFCVVRTTLAIPCLLADSRHMPPTRLPRRWPQSLSLANLQLPAGNLPFLRLLNRRTNVRSHFLINVYADYKFQPNKNCFNRHTKETTRLR